MNLKDITYVYLLKCPFVGFIREKWRPVVSYEGFYSDYYEVSNLGRVRSLDRDIDITTRVGKPGKRKVKGRLFRQTINKNGYKQVMLSKLGLNKTEVTHRLVAEAFIPNPHNKPHVNHVSGDKTNNVVIELEWCTHIENMKHASKTGLRPRGENHKATFLKDDQVIEICKLLDEGRTSRKEIARQYGVGVHIIHHISSGETWNHLTNRRDKPRLADYKGSNNPSAKAIVNCRGEVFKTMKEAGEKYDTSWTGISRVCRGVGFHAGKYKDGTPIKWKYYKKPLDKPEE